MASGSTQAGLTRLDNKTNTDRTEYFIKGLSSDKLKMPVSLYMFLHQLRVPRFKYLTSALVVFVVVVVVVNMT